MHEFSIVKSCVDNAVQQLEKQGAKRVKRIRFRRGSAFSPEALETAFAACTVGTILEDAILEIETVNFSHSCPCGHSQVVNSDDLMGHMFVCPKCGTIREIEEAHDLELIDVTVY